MRSAYAVTAILLFIALSLPTQTLAQGMDYHRETTLIDENGRFSLRCCGPGAVTSALFPTGATGSITIAMEDYSSRTVVLELMENGAPVKVAVVGGSMTHTLDAAKEYVLLLTCIDNAVVPSTDFFNQSDAYFTVSGLSTSATGAALNFRGWPIGNDYVQLTNPYTGFTDELTVEWWVNYSWAQMGSGLGQATQNVDNMNTNVWLMHMLPFTARTWNSDNIIWYVNNGGNWLSVSAQLGSYGWHHVAGTISKDYMRIYVDGQLVQEKAISGTLSIQANTSASINIGKDVRYDAGRFLNATIDEVRVWSTERSAAQIATNMNCELRSTDMVDLQLYYKFNQGKSGGNNSSQTIATDASGNGRNGTLKGFGSLSGTSSNWVAPGGVRSGITCVPFSTACDNALPWSTKSMTWTTPPPNASKYQWLLSGHQTTASGAVVDITTITQTEGPIYTFRKSGKVDVRIFNNNTYQVRARAWVNNRWTPWTGACGVAFE